MKLYLCEHCGNIIAFVKASGVPVVCCGEKMKEILPGSTDGAYEKHVPVITQEGNVVTVEVGSVAHPMVDVHYIEWIILQTTKGVHRINLAPGEEPKVKFMLGENEEVVCAYEYCNLHGFWKSN